MQKPRLTDRTAEAIKVALPSLRAVTYNVHADEDIIACKRAIEYLEDLLRWKRQRETARFKPVASQSADTLSKRQG